MGHYDHTGGLSFVLEKNTRAPIILHPGAFVERFSIRDQQARSIGMTDNVRKQITNNEQRLRMTDQPSEPLTGLHVTGFIPRETTFEDVGGPFFLDKQGSIPIHCRTIKPSDRTSERDYCRSGLRACGRDQYLQVFQQLTADRPFKP
jgi:metal-dependent hydrolase (beta-lactamase superfamily II)